MMQELRNQATLATLRRRSVLGRILLLWLLYASGTQSMAAAESKTPFRPRVIISTDFPPLDVIPVKAPPGGPPEKRSDPDDVQSMVRFLLYTNDFDVEGLIASSGTFANVANEQNILSILDVYDRVHAQLAAHDHRYPTANSLRSITWQGRSDTWGGPAVGAAYKPLESILGEGKDSEASDAVIRVVDKPDPRPVWICVWGGSREVAQAIWKARSTRTPGQFDQFIEKMRVFLIAKQDTTTDWLLDSFPNLFIILSEKNYMGMFWNMVHSDPGLSNLDWINEHIRHGHGPLGAIYPRSGWDPAYPGTQEGDTPSFLYLVSAVRGINDPEKPNQDSWGGKFVQKDPTKRHWFDDPEGTGSVSKWRKYVQADFAERLFWMKTR